MNDPWGRRRGADPAGGWFWWLALLLGVAAIIGVLAWRFPDAVDSRSDWGGLAYSILLLVFVSGSLIVGRRWRGRQFVKHAAAWTAVLLVILIGYAYRLELGDVGNRVLGELLPHRATNVGAGEVRVKADVDGHYRVEAVVDGERVLFLIDTGASDVVLSPADAMRLGHDLGRLRFTQIAETANGTVRSAPIRLDSVSVGRIRLTDFPASVNEADMGSSLLGMSFLNRLQSFEVRDGIFILRQ